MLRVISRQISHSICYLRSMSRRDAHCGMIRKRDTRKCAGARTWRWTTFSPFMSETLSSCIDGYIAQLERRTRRRIRSGIIASIYSNSARISRRRVMRSQSSRSIRY